MYVCMQEGCVLVVCCTTLVCHLVGVPVGLCQGLRLVAVTTVPRGVAVQTAVITTTRASAACSCKTSKPHASS